jgi:nitrate/TMAO reductase-like tetraheme cytochrome c subunit
MKDGMAEKKSLRLRVYDASGRAVRVKKRYLILVVLGLAAVAAAFLFVPFYVTTTPGFCSNCHIMDPFTTSWEHSTHSKFPCAKCHVKPGLVNHVVNQFAVSKNVYLNVFGQAGMPQQIRSATNENCLQGGCHSTNRKFSISGNLRIPHDDHIELRGLQCKDCHFNVVHTKDGGSPKPPMAVCAMCHDGKKAPNACSTCHVKVPTAAEAHPNLALEQHGTLAKGREKECLRCHHADAGFCEKSGCHPKGTFAKLTEEQRIQERFNSK